MKLIDALQQFKYIGKPSSKFFDTVAKDKGYRATPDDMLRDDWIGHNFDEANNLTMEQIFKILYDQVYYNKNVEKIIKE